MLEADAKTMDIHDTSEESLRNLVKRMAEFVAYFEIAETRMDIWKRDLEGKMENIHQLVTEFEKIACDAASEQQLQKVTLNSDEFLESTKKSLDRLDKATAYTVKSISDALSTFRVSDFQHTTKQSCDNIESAAAIAVTTLKNTVRWYHWKNLLLAIGVAIFATFTSAYYLSAKMPWELHKQVVAERQYGAALLNAWPHLSEEEQRKIILHSHRG